MEKKICMNILQLTFPFKCAGEPMVAVHLVKKRGKAVCRAGEFVYSGLL